MPFFMQMFPAFELTFYRLFCNNQILKISKIRKAIKLNADDARNLLKYYFPFWSYLCWKVRHQDLFLTAF